MSCQGSAGRGQHHDLEEQFWGAWILPLPTKSEDSRPFTASSAPRLWLRFGCQSGWKHFRFLFPHRLSLPPYLLVSKVVPSFARRSEYDTPRKCSRKSSPSALRCTQHLNSQTPIPFCNEASSSRAVVRIRVLGIGRDPSNSAATHRSVVQRCRDVVPVLS